jgi:hypothetical protein
MESETKDPGRSFDLRDMIHNSAGEAWDPDPMLPMFAQGFLK